MRSRVDRAVSAMASRSGRVSAQEPLQMIALHRLALHAEHASLVCSPPGDCTSHRTRPLQSLLDLAAGLSSATPPPRQILPEPSTVWVNVSSLEPSLFVLATQMRVWKVSGARRMGASHVQHVARLDRRGEASAHSGETGSLAIASCLADRARGVAVRAQAVQDHAAKAQLGADAGVDVQWVAARLARAWLDRRTSHLRTSARKAIADAPLRR